MDVCLDVYVSTGSWIGVWDCTLPAGHPGAHCHNGAVYWPRPTPTRFGS